MWFFVVFVCSAVGLALTLRQFRFVQDYPTRLLLVAFWARFSVAALPAYTTQSLVAGFSPIALTTLGFTGLMLLACRRRDFQSAHFAVYLPLIAVMVMSAGFNRTIVGLITELIAWTVFAATLQVTRMAIATNGMDRAMRALMAPFATPLLLQMASVALGRSIGSEEDGSRSFIGGYNHESVFSRFVMIFLVISMLVRWRSLWARAGLLLFSLSSIYLSNYRTTILAVLPIAGVALGSQALSVFRARYRVALLIALAMCAVVGFALAVPYLPPRYAQIFEAIDRFGELFQPPQAFSMDERKIFSSRFFIWSLYLTEYVNGTIDQIIFGLGSYADKNKFHIGHAHNSYVQYLYEYGIAGVAFLLLAMTINIMYCFKIRDLEQKAMLLSIHVGFIVLNLSTGVLKAIEGLQLYAIIMAATLALAQRQPSPPLRLAPRPLRPSDVASGGAIGAHETGVRTPHRR